MIVTATLVHLLVSALNIKRFILMDEIAPEARTEVTPLAEVEVKSAAPSTAPCLDKERRR